MEAAASQRYGRYAAAFLAVTVLAGVWLRTGMLRPEALAGVPFRNLVHAHSHLAFFGWATMALFAVALRSSGGGAGWQRWHAHLTGLASAAAFLGFLQRGYAPSTIALSAAHVALWAAFTVGVWRALARGARVEHTFLRTALAFLLIAGAGTIGTGILSARATDPWTRRLAIELFLTPFTAGWLVLGAFGAAYGRLVRPRLARLVLLLGAAGALPAGLLHVAGPPPFPWLAWVGRAGVLLVGIASLAFALDAWRERGVSPLLRLAGATALVKGVAEVAVGLGYALPLTGSPPVVVAYLHLVLLGMVTPILADALLAPARAAAPAALHAAGLVLQLGALAALGWAPLLVHATATGWDATRLLALALAGGVLSAAGLGLVALRVLARPMPGGATAAQDGREEGTRVRDVVATAASR